MKVSELTGIELDRWVASADPRCEGCSVEFVADDRTPHYIGRCDEGVAFFIPSPGFLQAMRLKRKYPEADEYSPSRDWRDGGRLIERERMTIFPADGDAFFGGEPVSGPRWLARCESKPCNQIGKTPLEAAMRAFVEAKIGAEVPSNS